MVWTSTSTARLIALQRQWLVVSHALQVATKRADKADLQAQLAAVGREIAAALSVDKLIKLSPQAHGAAGLWGKLGK